MIPVKSPNSWGCLVASTATLLNVSYDKIIEELGHDGSKIVFPDLSDPKCRRSFILEEIIDLLWHRGMGLVSVSFCPVISDGEIVEEIFTDLDRINRYLSSTVGLLQGSYAIDRPHICAWDGTHVIDPKNASIKTLEESDLIVEQYHILTRINPILNVSKHGFKFQDQGT